MYIFLAILAFGIMIASHEFGHFIAAKACGVKVNEFAIGMGPALWKKQGKETLYALRILPIGGYCAMEGEDEETDDPRAFTKQGPWKKFIILVAGATMNFITGFIVVVLLYINANYFVTSTVVELVEGFKYAENGIQAGDEIYSIDGKRIFYSSDFSTYMSRSVDGAVDMVVIRNGEKVTLKNYPLAVEEYVVDGEKVMRYGVTFEVVEANIGEKLKYSCYTAYNFGRMVWMGLSDFVRGTVGINDMSGVVGIVNTINEVGETSETKVDAFLNIAYLCAFISVNLGIMNLLPIPALDGGRIFLLAVTTVIEKITRKHIDPKYEGYIHAAGMVVLLGLMAIVMYFDVARIING